MSAQLQLETWTEDEYLAMEEKSEVKHEFVHGIPYAMAGGTFNHTTVCFNLARHIGNHLSGKPCRARSSEQKVKSEKSGNTFYPDAVIFCPPSRFEGKGDQLLLTPPSSLRFSRLRLLNTTAPTNSKNTAASPL